MKLTFPRTPYPVYLSQAIPDATLFAPHIMGRRVVIISQAPLRALYQAALSEAWSAYEIAWIDLPLGEAQKTLATWQRVLEDLQAHQHDRHTTLIAFGGGMVSDMTGFVAATFQRGCPYLVVPTTLLSQVDAALGGKTGVNLGNQKNAVGVIYQPQAIVIHPGFLQSLPPRDFHAGLAEVTKYALMQDASFFRWLETHIQALLAKEEKILEDAIQTCIRAKLHLVELDEQDHGCRQYLNFGHTLGHALEAATGYASYQHGEAVAWGMMFALFLSERVLGLSNTYYERVRLLLQTSGLLVERTSWPSTDALLSSLLQDKKRQGGVLRWVLLQALGEPKMVSLQEEVVRDYLLQWIEVVKEVS